MNDSHEKTRSIYFENVIIGEKSSRISSAVMALLCIVPVFAMILFGAVDNVTWVFITIFAASIVLLWLAESWKGKGLLLNTTAIQIPLVGVLLIGLIQLLPLGSGVPSDLLNVPVSHAISLDPYTTRFFILHLVVYIVFFAACLTFINKESRLKKAFLMVIIFGSVMAFFGILQRLANPDGIYGLRGTPQSIPFGPFVNRHHFAAFMEMTSGITIGLLLGKKTAKDKKILLLMAVIVMIVAIALTSSRGGMLGVISVTAFVGMLNIFSGRWSKEKPSSAKPVKSIQRKAAMAAGVAALVILIFGIVLSLGGYDELLRGIGASQIQDGVSNGRSHFWQIAIQIFFEHPIFGAGLEAFGMAFTKHDTWNGQFRVEQAHNEYLQMLADAGIAGIVCVAAFIYLLFKKGFKRISNAHGLRRDVAIGALAGCFGILIHSFFDFPLRTPSNAFFFLLLCAIATVPIESERSKPSRRISSANAPSQ